MSRNPFDEEEDDFSFSNTGHSSYSQSNFKSSTQVSCAFFSYGLNQAQIQTSRDSALESSKRALQTLTSTQKVAVDTSEELNLQGEKLQRTEARLDEIRQLQKESDRNIKGLQSWGFGFFNKFRRPVEVASQPVSAPSSQKVATIETSATIARDLQVTTVNDPKGSEFNRNLQLMGGHMANLRLMADNMNAELRSQSDTIHRISDKTESVNTVMANQTRSMNKILGKK